MMDLSKLVLSRNMSVRFMICLTFEYEVSWISFGYWMKTHSASEGSASL